jgi:hypothetical protein
MWYGMDPNGIKEVVIEFDTGDEEVWKQGCATSSNPSRCGKWRITSAPFRAN